MLFEGQLAFCFLGLTSFAKERHVGDMGNIEADSSALLSVHMLLSDCSLRVGTWGSGGVARGVLYDHLIKSSSEGHHF